MSFIQIDESKCKRDGLCVADCTSAILRQPDKKSIPEMVAGGEQTCMVCGHCVAICPHQAFSHQLVPAEQSPTIEKEHVISQEQAVQFLRSRRSVRHYKEKAPTREQIQELIEIARYAPTGSNTQTVAWTVMTRKEDLKQISELTVDWMRDAVKNPPPEGLAPYIPRVIGAWDFGIDVICRDAPVLIIASTPGEGRNGMVDLSIALAYLELAAVPMGLGTCWAGLVQGALIRSKALQDFIQLPESHTSHYPMMLGFPKYRYHQMPERKEPQIFWK